MTRCNTLLCGNEAVWQLVKEGQPTVYKCETCHDKGCFAHDEGWTRIMPPAPLMASRIASYHNANT